MSVQNESDFRDGSKDGVRRVAHLVARLGKRLLDPNAFGLLEDIERVLNLTDEARDALMIPEAVATPRLSERAIKRMFGKPMKIGVIQVENFLCAYGPDTTVVSFVTIKRQNKEFHNIHILPGEVVKEWPRPSLVLEPERRYEVFAYKANEAFHPKTAVDFLIRKGFKLPGLYGGMMIWNQLGSTNPELFGLGRSEGAVMFLDHEPCLPRDTSNNSRIPVIDVYKTEHGGYFRDFGWGTWDDVFSLHMSHKYSVYIVGLRPVQ